VWWVFCATQVLCNFLNDVQHLFNVLLSSLSSFRRIFKMSFTIFLTLLDILNLRCYPTFLASPNVAWCPPNIVQHPSMCPWCFLNTPSYHPKKSQHLLTFSHHWLPSLIITLTLPHIHSMFIWCCLMLLESLLLPRK
jgi:hypothetical protein